jgi:Zn-dependent M28 family amino/carboxypeptidase
VVKGVKIPNVICTLPGTTDSVILVGAHTDHTSNGLGVIDDWSGAALLPSLYESLRNKPRLHTYVFIGFSEEESGLKGSGYYAKQMKPDESTRTRAMVNIDSVGLGPSAVWVSRADKGLTSAAWVIATSLKLPLKAINVEKVGSSDSESFKELNIPRITFHSVTQDTLRILHSVRDTEKALRLDDYYETYRLLAAYLAYLDTILGRPGSAP